MRYAVLFLTLLACRTEPAAVPESDMTLKAYDVPEASGQEVASILADLMYKKESDKWSRLGSARVAPNGRQVLVSAPASFQKGVGAWLEQLKSADAPAAPPKTVKLEYWLVAGKPAPERKQDKTLSPLQAALDALVSEYGPQELTFVDRVTLAGRSGEKISNKSNKFSADHVAIVRGDVVDAEIDLHGPQTSLRSRLNVPVGKLVVIGDAQAQDNVTQYYIVRASIL